MNKAELISEIAEKVNMSKKDTEAVVEEVFSTIKDKVSVGEKIAIAGFGSFEKKHREASKRRNPKTQEPVDVPATDVPHFKASSAFKENCK